MFTPDFGTFYVRSAQVVRKKTKMPRTFIRGIPSGLEARD